jgi:hypothetical protein
MSKRVVIVDDNQTIKVVVYHGAEGVAAEVTPQRALDLALSLLAAARRHLPNDPATGLKLFP